jgi:hypothetical protein
MGASSKKTCTISNHFVKFLWYISGVGTPRYHIQQGLKPLRIRSRGLPDLWESDSVEWHVAKSDPADSDAPPNQIHRDIRSHWIRFSRVWCFAESGPAGGWYPRESGPAGGWYPRESDPAGGWYPRESDPAGGWYPRESGPAGGWYPRESGPAGGWYLRESDPAGGWYLRGGNQIPLRADTPGNQIPRRLT